MKQPHIATPLYGSASDTDGSSHGSVSGTPLVTRETGKGPPFKDDAEWEAWKRARARESQRTRRSKLRRIDYYASEEAARIIDARRRPFAGGDASSIINRALLAWAGGDDSGI